MVEQDITSLLRTLPSVDALLRTDAGRVLVGTVGAQHLATLARAVTEEMRQELQAMFAKDDAANGNNTREALLNEAVRRLEDACDYAVKPGIRRVINATGVILHTNLGRSPLSKAARRAISEEAAGYCTLEFETETGKRGRRGARVEQLLTQLTGAEDALVVNNCAAAALLVLTVIAQSGETLVSRGELVEIGGDFRVPDVMNQSGTRLVEVGTTNRTRLTDYKRALTSQTRLLMRVHPSNYRIVGFTAAPTLAELAKLAHESGLPLYEDAGSGVLTDLTEFGLQDEPVISQSIANGADLVSFSGDKLLGSAQSGVIVGRKEFVERLRRAPLYRALRADKLCLAALEATLDAHRRGAALEEIPALAMLAMTTAQMTQRANNFLASLRRSDGARALQCEIIEGQSAIGGGAAPTTHPQTSLLALTHETLSADELEKALRHSTPPVIARIAENKVLLDLRTVFVDEEPELLEILLSGGTGRVSR